MTQEKNITYNEIELRVKFDYEKPDYGDYWTPPSGGCVEIQNVFVEKTDIYDLLSDKQFEELEELILKKLEE